MSAFLSPEPARKPEPIAPPPPHARLVAEIAGLPRDRVLVEVGAVRVIRVRQEEAPTVVYEIGRLRERTFRAAGEGTGRAVDLDRFDAWYDHLLVWRADAQAVAGAYRIGRCDEILSVHGPEGLYTHTLFAYKEPMYAALRGALELGRSFVCQEHQRLSNALLLLWRAFGQYVLREPRYRRLVGPVSIDRNYSSEAVQLMVGYLGARHGCADLAVHTPPRRPFAPFVNGSEAVSRGAALPDMATLDRAVAAGEPDGRGVPVLIRQYLRMGAEVLAFNVDPDFSDVVDALMMLDLDRVADDRLAWFMGRPEVRAWREAKPAFYAESAAGA